LIVEAVKSGLSSRAVGKQFKVNSSTVRYILQRHLLRGNVAVAEKNERPPKTSPSVHRMIRRLSIADPTRPATEINN
jgi:hypothetical protein